MRDQSAAPTTDLELRQAMSVEAKKLMVDSTYTSRGNLEAAERWWGWDKRIGLTATVLSTLLATGAVITALEELPRELTAVFAGLSALSSATQAFLRPAQLAEQFGLKGNRLIGLRNDLRFFRDVELRSALSTEELAGRLTNLRNRYADLVETAPLHIPAKDYEKAKRNIERGQANYENDPLWKELGD